MHHAENPAFQFALRLLRPAIQVFIRFGVAQDILIPAIRWLYMDIGRNTPEFWHEGKSPDSRVATVTGLTRRWLSEVKDFENVESLVNVTAKGNRASRVLAGWIQDSRFTHSGKPKVLPWRASKGTSFHQLVKEYSNDVPPPTIADELVRNGCIERRSDNTVKVLREAFIPQDDVAALLDVEATCVADFLRTVEYNLNPNNETKRYQREAFDAHIPIERKPELDQELRKMLERHTLETNALITSHADREPAQNRTYCRVGAGQYYFDNPQNLVGGSDESSGRRLT